MIARLTEYETMPRPSKRTVLQEKAQATPTRFNVSTETKSAMEAIEKRLRSDYPDLSIDFDGIVEDALNKAIKAAKRELDELESRENSTGQRELADADPQDSEGATESAAAA